MYFHLACCQVFPWRSAAAPMRLVHLSDLHLGYRQYQRSTPAGHNQREADVAGVFRTAIDRIIALGPDLVVIAGDVFHNVRPSNPAILVAFRQFSRLAQALPDAIIVVVAGNHDTPRAVETGCILRLFEPLGIHVVDQAPQRLTFAERGLSVLAVPDVPGERPQLEPDPAFRYNVLVLHGEVAGVIPASLADADRSAVAIAPEDLGVTRWSYVALGHYHVFRQLAPNAYYSGSLEYTSANVWGELVEERAARLPGKGMIEYNLETGKRTFHPLPSPHQLIDLPHLNARGLTAAEVDEAVRRNVDRCPGGIDDKIVRQVVRDLPRHVFREMDHKALRELRRRAMHYHLDARRPEVVRSSAAGSPGKRPSLIDTVRDKLRSRELPADIEREALVELGLRYLREADAVETAALAPPSDTD
jgi:DNA repair exonuclease SbcCD nuclease subunit